MPESLDAEVAIFLRAVREELAHSEPGNDPFRPIRAQRLVGAIDHLIMRAENGAAHASAGLADARRLLEPHGDSFHVQSGSDDGSFALATAARERASGARSATAADADYDSFVAALRADAQRRAERRAEGLLQAGRDRAQLFGTAREETPALTAAAVEIFLKTRFPEHSTISVANFVRPAGVYSKENYSFDIVGLEAQPIKAILRRDRGFEIIPTSASGEFELLNALRDQGQPVARCIAAQTDSAAPLNGPCLIMERVPGAPPGMARTSPEDKEEWSAMVLQLAAALARLHSVDVSRLPLDGSGQSNRAAFLAVLDEYHDRLHRCEREPYPLVEAAFVWLYNHAGLIDDTTVMVHGDYDMRNVLFEEGKLTAILDFELAHIGHPAEDLGYVAPDVLETMDYGRFMEAYQAAGGPAVAPRLIHYFHVWRWTFHAVCNIVAFSGYRSGVHDDLLLGTVSFVEFRRVQEKLMALLPGGPLYPA
ncbi:phosphotransferase family protein [Novosphingobium aquimarinum]|uniref:phosphotransferase family protein n=1 Tax=Novosphingobium aquimarinum TaxID=2682494 RepID=UPI0018DC1F3B|nr:phosphotransferase family protein [Novosphingobium aquimarinum]